MVAAPKLQIEERVERLEKAFDEMAYENLSQKDYEKIRKILDGTETASEARTNPT
jgi:hypothetical protein